MALPTRPFDELGLEAPFAESRGEGESIGKRFGSSLPESELGESPFAEASAANLSEDPQSLDEGATSFEDEAFPSGLVLQPTTGATGQGEEHWDPHATGLPLLATPKTTHAQRVSPHFTVKELVSSGGRAALKARISSELVKILEAIREHASKPVRITSGYRSWARNQEIYKRRGEKPTKSRHCSGQAADIKIAGLSGVDIARLAIDAAGPDLAIGIGRDYIHVDVRGTWTLWNYIGGSAGRAAEQEVQEHRKRHLRSRASIPIPPRPAPPAPPSPQPAGRTNRLVVDKHPLLRDHRGTPPDLILRWNSITQPGDIDVVVHFHGYAGQLGAMRLDLHKERLSGLDFEDPDRPGSIGCTRPTLALLPRGNFFGGRLGTGYNFPALVGRGSLDKLIEDALSRVSRETGHRLRMGRLILTGHSGGGSPVSAVLAHIDPDEVHIFDGMYAPSPNLVRWAERRVARELATPASLPPALRVLYRQRSQKDPGTQPHSEALARELCRILAPREAARLRPLFRVDRTAVDHNDIPRRFGWRLLADPAAEPPGVKTFGCASFATNEAAETFETWSERSYAGEQELASEQEEGQAESDEALAWLDVEAPRAGTIWLEPPSAEDEEYGTETSAESDEVLEAFEGFEGEAFDALDAAEGEREGEEEEEWREDEDAFAPHVATLEGMLEAEVGAGTSLADRVKGAAALVLGPNLRRGDNGPAVAALQRHLAGLGTDLAIDGKFGPNTERAVRAFQARSGLNEDGVVGPRTKAAIAAALGKVSPAPPQPSTLCATVAQVAEQEFRRWHPSSGNVHETDNAAVAILQQYYREGVNQTVSAADLQNQNWQSNHPWSAVFVSWVMRTAGAGTAFAYSPGHYVYVAAAKRNRLAANASNPFWAYRPTEVTPEVGDLICWERQHSGVNFDNVDDGQRRASHCDVVTVVRPRSLRVVGGNVNQNVDAKLVRTLPDGKVALDGKQARIYAIVRCRAGSASNAANNISFSSLVPGGFYSSNPYDLSVRRSIRTNNPGALNISSWQKTFPGYVGFTAADNAGNRTTIYRTPEHGVAAWYRLLVVGYGYGQNGNGRVADIARRYAGVANEDDPRAQAYVAGWRRHTNGQLTGETIIRFADNDTVLLLAHGMYAFEAGRPTPLSDAQIRYGIDHYRAGDLPP